MNLKRIAGYSLLVLFPLIVLFHLLVLAGVVPFQIVGGGRIETRTQMVQVELMAIVTNLLMLAVVAAYMGILRSRFSDKALRVALWIMAAIFALNTVGNWLSVNEFERAVFTPVTLVLCAACVALALAKEEKAR